MRHDQGPRTGLAVGEGLCGAMAVFACIRPLDGQMTVIAISEGQQLRVCEEPEVRRSHLGLNFRVLPGPLSCLIRNEAWVGLSPAVPQVSETTAARIRRTYLRQLRADPLWVRLRLLWSRPDRLTILRHLGSAPQLGETCLRSNETGHLQRIAPASARWALYGPLSQAPMRIASAGLYASA